MYKEIFERKLIDGGKTPEVVSFLFSDYDHLVFYSTREQGHCKVFPKQALNEILEVLSKYEPSKIDYEKTKNAIFFENGKQVYPYGNRNS